MEKQLKSILRPLYHWYREFKLNFIKPSYGAKVFCIGYNKTGTTSLGKALGLLGYRHTGFKKKVWREYYRNNETKKLLNYMAKFDSADDLPWLKEDIIPILDQTFPGSKFIYLTRDENSWKKSFYNWHYRKTSEYPDVEEKWKEYKAHEVFVINYFKNRPNDILVLEIKDGHGFLKLANFLGKKPIQNHFPHFNKGS